MMHMSLTMPSPTPSIAILQPCPRQSVCTALRTVMAELLALMYVRYSGGCSSMRESLSWTLHTVGFMAENASSASTGLSGHPWIFEGTMETG